MANNHRCGCSGRRNPNNYYGCLDSIGGRNGWDCGPCYGGPYYSGPCPDSDGRYCGGEDRRQEWDDGCRRRRRCRGGRCGVFTAMLPVAVAANGVIPLVNSRCIGDADDFKVNSGMVTIEEEGTYLATYTVRVPEGQALDSTVTLNVNDASQASAVSEVGGEGPSSFTAQAIFDVSDRASLTLRSSGAINLTETSAQPLVTLSLVRLNEE